MPHPHTHTEETVTGGRISMVVKYYNIVTVLSEVYDLCDVASQASLDCPITPGQHTFFTSLTKPLSYPTVSEALCVDVYSNTVLWVQNMRHRYTHDQIPLIKHYWASEARPA